MEKTRGTVLAALVLAAPRSGLDARLVWLQKRTPLKARNRFRRLKDAPFDGQFFRAGRERAGASEVNAKYGGEPGVEDELDNALGLAEQELDTLEDNDAL